MEVARACGLPAEPGVPVGRPVPATDAELELVHDPRYIEAVRLAGGTGPGRPGPGGPGPRGPQPGGPGPGGPQLGAPLLRFGLGTPDDPVFPGMHDASALVAGATLPAARAVPTGGAEPRAAIPGGLGPPASGTAHRGCGLNHAPAP